MSKTSISLSDHFDGFISAQIANGHYDSASEVILAALQIMEEHEMKDRTKLETLRTALIEGETSGDSSVQIDEIIAAEKQRRVANRAGIYTAMTC